MTRHGPARSVARVLRLAATLLLLSTLAACGGQVGHAGSLSYEFDHPREWQRLDVDLPNAAAVTTDTVGLDGRNWVSVSSEGLAEALTADQVAAAPRDLRARLTRELAAVRISLVDAPRTTRFAGLAGLEYTIAFEDEDGTPLHSRIVTLFSEREAFSIGCQSSRPNAQQIADGCSQVLATLEVQT